MHVCSISQVACPNLFTSRCLDYSSWQPSARYAYLPGPSTGSASHERASSSPCRPSTTRRLEYPCCSFAPPANASPSCCCSTTSSSRRTCSSFCTSSAYGSRCHHGWCHSRLPRSTAASTAYVLWLPCPASSAVLRPGISATYPRSSNASILSASISHPCPLPTSSTSTSCPCCSFSRWFILARAHPE